LAHSSVLQQGGAQEAHDAAWLIDDAHYAEAKAKVYNSKHNLPAEAVKGEGRVQRRLREFHRALLQGSFTLI
jgi:hypothetical protein